MHHQRYRGSSQYGIRRPANEGRRGAVKGKCVACSGISIIVVMTDDLAGFLGYAACAPRRGGQVLLASSYSSLR